LPNGPADLFSSLGASIPELSRAQESHHGMPEIQHTAQWSCINGRHLRHGWTYEGLTNGHSSRDHQKSVRATCTFVD